jgi:hypothetical protein
LIIKNNTPDVQFGIFADKSIFNFTKKKKFTDIKKGIVKFYSWAQRSS